MAKVPGKGHTTYRCVFFFGSRKHLSCTQVLYLQASSDPKQSIFFTALGDDPDRRFCFSIWRPRNGNFSNLPETSRTAIKFLFFASLETSRRQILFVWICKSWFDLLGGGKIVLDHVPRNTQFSPRVRATPSATYATVMHQRASPVKMIVVRKMALCCDHFSGRLVWGPATPCWILVGTCDIMRVSCWAPFSSFSCGGPCCENALQNVRLRNARVRMKVSESYRGLTLLFLGRNDKVGSLLVSRQPRAAQARPTCSVPRIPRQIKKIRVRVKTSVCRGLSGSLLVSLTLFKKEA